MAIKGDQDVIALIRQELPELVRQDPEIRAWVLQIAEERFADRAQTESRFEQLLEELRRDREEWNRRWEEQRAEWNRRWEEQRAESERRWEEIVEERAMRVARELGIEVYTHADEVSL